MPEKQTKKTDKPKHCRVCDYYNLELNICNDKEMFINKLDIKLPACRYNDNAIPFSKVKEYNKK